MAEIEIENLKPQHNTNTEKRKNTGTFYFTDTKFLFGMIFPEKIGALTAKTISSGKYKTIQFSSFFYFVAYVRIMFNQLEKDYSILAIVRIKLERE